MKHETPRESGLSKPTALYAPLFWDPDTPARKPTVHTGLTADIPYSGGLWHSPGLTSSNVQLNEAGQCGSAAVRLIASGSAHPAVIRGSPVGSHARCAAPRSNSFLVHRPIRASSFVSRSNTWLPQIPFLGPSQTNLSRSISNFVSSSTTILLSLVF